MRRQKRAGVPYQKSLTFFGTILFLHLRSESTCRIPSRKEPRTLKSALPARDAQVDEEAHPQPKFKLFSFVKQNPNYRSALPARAGQTTTPRKDTIVMIAQVKETTKVAKTQATKAEVVKAKVVDAEVAKLNIAKAKVSKTEATKEKVTKPKIVKNEIEAEVTDTEILIHQDDRRYRIRGLEKNLSLARLHINLKVDRNDAMHINSFDLYSDRHRAQFIKRASEELYVDEDILKRDIARILRKLEELQAEKAEQATAKKEKPVELSKEEHGEAMLLLEDPKLLDRIVADYDTCGLVGEETNKVICYLACISRRLSQPLAVLIQSSSAAGKTTLMDAALAFVPAEEQIKYSAMTGQSLYLPFRICRNQFRRIFFGLQFIFCSGRLCWAS